VNKRPPSFDQTIAAYYGQAPEEMRLEQIPFRLDEIRTRDPFRSRASYDMLDFTRNVARQRR